MAGPPRAVGSVPASAVAVKRGGVSLQAADSWGSWGQEGSPTLPGQGEEVTPGPSSADHAQGRPGDQMRAERNFPDSALGPMTQG